MRKPLTHKEVKELRYQCRMGYVFPGLLFIIGTFVTSAIYELNFNTETKGIIGEMTVVIMFAFGLLSLLISCKMNWKYLSDLRNGEKIVETKIISKKEQKIEYEAGSGTLYFGQEMKGFDSFSIVVENVRYRIDEKLFDSCAEGEKILFNYAPKSRFLVSIEVNANAL